MEALLASPFGTQVTHHRVLPAKQAHMSAPQRPLSPAVHKLLQTRGVENLYSHQAHAVDVVRSGRAVVVATPTASGKSLVYTLPVLESFLQDPEARALYIFPLKALSQDQKNTFEAFTAPWAKDARPSIAIYDGDTSAHFRRKLRLSPPQVLITTPEMLHLGIVAHHEKWSTFFAGLTHIVVDEAHTYRGVLGAHMAQLFQRVQRIAARYGARPNFILCTATVGNGQELAQNLLGPAHNPLLIDESGAPQGQRHFAFLNPELSPSSAAIGLLKSALARNLRTIVYCRSRRMTELLALWVSQYGQQWEGQISAYRAGFLPEERRHIEEKMHSGELKAIISTSALELGIDIGSLDLCILVGYPGTIMSTLQRGGRVGRAQQDSAVVLVAGEDALDQYIVRHPEDFFTRAPEKAIINIYNATILEKHLCCAAAESPLRPQDKDTAWLSSPAAQKALASLCAQGQLLQSADGSEYLCARKRPQRHVDLRGQDDMGGNYTIEDAQGNCIGTVDAIRALKENHPGAVYLHRGQSYEIASLDQNTKRIVAKPAKRAWFTKVRTQKHTDILEIKEHKPLHAQGSTHVAYGRLRITEHITGYEKRSVKGNRLLSIIPLDFAPLVFETMGLWITIPDAIRHQLEEEYIHFIGAIHALEHMGIGMMPLHVMADRNDFGGISTPLHAELALPAIFIYDALPGGAGLCEEAYAQAFALFEHCHKAMSLCTCDDGCPSCVHSPKCGSGNRPLSKMGALRLLELIMKMKIDGNQHVLPLDALQEKLQSQQKASQKNTQENAQTKTSSRYMVLDVETRRSAAEVGGWHQAAHMGVSIAVLYDSLDDSYNHYQQDELEDMFARMQQADLIIGFNIARFDYTVLQPFCAATLKNLPTLDLLEKVKSTLNYRVSLDNIATATLDAQKSADGLQALAWWKEGRLDLIAEYCQKDVEITKLVYEYGLEHGHVLFTNKAKQKVRLPVDFTL